MGKKKLIIGGLLVIIAVLMIVFVIFGNKPKPNTDTNNLSTDNTTGTSKEPETPPKAEIETTGEDLTEVIKIDEYIPDKSKEEVKEILNEKVSEEQKEVVNEAIENNEIPLNSITSIELEVTGNNLASVQETIAIKLQTVFNKFIADAQMGKYEYEKVMAMVAAYANNLKTEIENSKEYSEEDLAVISGMIIAKLSDYENQLTPYIGYSHVMTEDELIEYGYIDESQRGQKHPYQEIVDGTVEEAQSKYEQSKNEIMNISEGE